ncbi:MAG: hypothetical protein Q9168_005590 [Polycauliona sp. 1 TL-2023]
MATSIPSIPNEVLHTILKYLMQSDSPVETSMYAKLARLSHPDLASPPSSDSSTTSTDHLAPCKPCTEDVCTWFSDVQAQSRCLCALKPWPEPQVEHLKDWTITNGVSHRFRALAKEAFFRTKTFVIAPNDIDRLCYNATTLSVLMSCRQVIVPLPNFTSPSPWLTLPRFQIFDNLRVLAIWPAMHHYSDTSGRGPEKLSQDPAPEILLTVLKDIGLGRANLRIDIIRIENGAWPLSEALDLEARVFPVLRWMGEKKKKQQMDMDNNVKRLEAEDSEHCAEKTP